MSKNLYEATILQLKGKALEAYAALELLLKNPTAIPEHSDWVGEIIKHTATLAENESAMIKLQQYFGKEFQEKPASPQRGMPVAAPNIKKELKQKVLEAAKARQRKEELYPAAEASELSEQTKAKNE